MQQLRRALQALAVTGVLLVVSMGVSVFAWRKRQEPNASSGVAAKGVQQSLRDRRNATIRPDVLASKLATLSLLGGLSPKRTGVGLELSLLLGIQAVKLGETPGTGYALFFALNAHPTLLSNLHGHSQGIQSLAYSPDGKTLASASWEHIELWDSAKAAPNGISIKTQGGVYAIAWSPDGEILAAAGADHKVRLFNTKTGALLGDPLEGHSSTVSSVAFSPDGKWLASASWDETARVWDTTTRRAQGDPLKHGHHVNGIGWSADGKKLFTITYYGVWVWDVATRRHDAPPKDQFGTQALAIHHDSDTEMLAVARSRGVQLWNASTRKAFGPPLRGDSEHTESVAFSKDGKLLAAGGADGAIRLWRTTDGSPAGTMYEGHSDWVQAVAFHPHGKVLASGGRDATIRLWNVSDEPPTGILKASGSVRTVAFSPDGQSLASGSHDGTVRLWDALTGKLKDVTLANHDGEVTSIAFSPDGTIIATGCTHTGSVQSVAFQPDGKRLASGSADGTVRLWDVDLGSWMDRACRVANRNLTQEEWTAYLPGRLYEKVCEEFPVPEH